MAAPTHLDTQSTPPASGEFGTLRVVIAGGTGLVGSALRKHLTTQGHEALVLRREPGGDWDPATNWMRPGVLDGVDAVVNLAGASIGEGRWSAARKELLRSSRIESTRLLVAEMANLPQRPALINASAIGYYGDRADEVLDESSASGSGFLAELVRDWETEASKATAYGARTAILRFGIVLAKDGGALPRMVLPFKFGAGGRLGSGTQWFSWAALPDVVRAIEWAVASDASGTYNVCAPNPVTNKELTRALAEVMHRPALFPAPPFALRLALGESADELLLASQRVLPRRLQAEGFQFQHPEIEAALAEILKGK